MSTVMAIASISFAAARAGVVQGAAALLAALLAGCGADAAPPPAPQLVRAVVVASSMSANATRYTAEIRSRYETDLAFRVGGKLVRRLVDAGAAVHKGDVLAQLDEADLRLGVDASRSALDAASAELDRARFDEARYRDLVERGLTTRAAYVAQRTTVKTSQSRLEQARADLRLSEQQLSYATLRADEDGVVTRTLAEAGAVVGAGQAVVSVARPDELEAVFDVPDSHIDDIRDATAVHFALLDDPATQYAASVREVSPSADAVTRTYEVKTSIAQPPAKLRLGMTVTVTVTVEHAGGTPGIALPATALFQQAHDPAVWVVNDAHALELRPVDVARYESDAVYVSAGLEPGDRVVTAGVHRLAAGQVVRLMDEVQP
jgi:membrane fusion protein, multidrug efflux system